MRNGAHDGSISSLLKAARLRLGLKQQELGEMASLSHATIQRCEKGTLDVSKDTAEAVAPHLRLDPEKLVALAFLETDVKKLKRVYEDYPNVLERLDALNGLKEKLLSELAG